MELRVLGPVEATVGGRRVPLGAVKQRAVLAMLALHANSTVSADELMEGLWGEHPPSTAPKMLQQYISQLRRLLGGGNGRAAEIVTHGRGYELRLGPEEIDLGRFQRLVSEGAAREALSLWRGPPLADVADEPFAAGEIRRLDELRLAALEQAIDAELAEGRHREVVGELEALVAAHPLSERVHGQLMLALYRSGRQAEALEAYRRARSALVEEIGVEPGPDLRALHEAILRQDPALAAPARPELPQELETTSPLVGREAEMERLRAAWERARGGRPAVMVISGPEGIGRTRLVAELAGEVHRQGALVLYGADAIERARAARRPTLLVLDELPETRVLEAAAHAAGPLLIAATTSDPVLAGRLPDADHLALGPLDPDGVAAIAALYAPDRAQIPAAELAERSGGVPARVHRLAAQWARAEAARRLGDVAGRTAVERSDLRRSEEELAGTVVALQAVRERADRQEADRATVLCPFKGLASFDFEDAEFFFGRERLVAAMVARLVGSPLLGVVGPSGSGKSSALRAGLLREVASGVLPGSEHWDRALLRPGEHPMRALTQAVGGTGRDVRVLIAVDQFEEAFTLCRDEQERAAFIGALARSARDPERRAAVVLAVRADFYGRCAAYPELSRLLDANHVLVGPMQRDELRRAIELPAQRGGLRVEPELVDRLLADVEDEPGALPLLSAALLELWQQRDGRQLRLAAYERTGGVRGAVARLAEAAYERLEPEQQVIARRVLLRLAGEDVAGAPVRRRVRLDELDADRDDNARRVLDVLADSRLVTVSEGTAEVAHEALLREWPRLRGWLAEDAEGRRLHQHLAAAAREWDAGGRDPGELYRGARLASTLDWSAEHEAELNAVERAFVDASRTHSEREARRARRTNRRLRTLLAGAGALLVLAVVAGVLFLDQRGEARDEARTAEAQRLGTQALVEDDLDRSLLLARQGVEHEDSLQTRSNLLAALLRSPAAIGVVRSEGARLLQIALRPDGRALVVGDNHGVVAFLDPQTLRRLRPPYRPPRIGEFPSAWYGVAIRDLAFSPDGSRLAVRRAGSVVLLDGRTWRQVAAVKVPDAETSNDLPTARDPTATFSPDGRTLSVSYTLTLKGDVPTTILRIDVRAGRPLGRPVQIASPGGVADILAFRPDGRRMVTAEDRATVVRDTRTLRALHRIPGAVFGTPAATNPGQIVPDIPRNAEPRDIPRAQAFALSADGRTLAVGGLDGSVRFVDVSTGEQRVASGRHQAAVQGAVFSPDGRFLVTVGDDANAIVWDVEAGAAGETLEGHAGRVLAVALDREARTLFTAGLDGSVISWDLVGDRRLGRPFDAGTGAGPGYPSTALSRDGRTLVTAQEDGALSVVETGTLTQRSVRIRVGRSPVYAPAFGPGGTLVVAGFDGTLAVVDPRTGRQIAPLRGHRDIVFTPTTSADGSIVASTGLDSTLRLWDARAGRPLGAPIELDSPPFSDAGIAPDGRTVAVSLERGTIDVFDVRSRRRVARVRVDDSIPMFSRFSRDGRFLLGGSRDGRVRVFSARDWHSLGPAFDAHAGFVSSVDASPDGRTLVTTGTDGQVRLWDLASRRPIGSALPGPKNINAVAQFAPDGRHLFAVFGNGRGYRWDVRPESWARHACEAAGRRLSRGEWEDALPGRDYAPAC